MDSVFGKLKEWLKERKEKYVEHRSWVGDTESGFYSTDEFDMDKLLAEIDAFSEQLKSERRK